MAYIWQRWLAKELRAAGLKVVEVEGWENRGRPASTGNFDPRGPVTTHHTGSTTSASRQMPTLQTLIKGRPDLPGPLAQVGVAYDGTVYIIAAGRANHAGRIGKRGIAGMPYGADGNALAIGDEVDTNGTQRMPAPQRNAIAGVNAVVLKHFKRGTDYSHRHEDISGTGKWDLGSLTTAQVRGDAGARLKVLSTAPAPVASHARWALRTTGVYTTPGGKNLRNLAPGDSFRVIDGSGRGGWIQTTSGNWVLGEDTTKTIFSTFLWNVMTGRSWSAAILPELNEMLAAEKPDTVGLLEAYGAPDLRGLVPGYSYVYQALGYAPATRGYVEEHSECVVLVRDGLEVKAREALEMKTSWKGPKVGALHDPRIIRRVTVEKSGVACRPIYGHGPFGATAVAEFNTAMVGELQELGDLGPAMALADWNQDYATVTTKVGNPAGAKVDGGGIDLAAYKSCTKIKGKNLGPHGSDHDAKIWTFGV